MICLCTYFIESGTFRSFSSCVFCIINIPQILVPTGPLAGTVGSEFKYIINNTKAEAELFHISQSEILIEGQMKNVLNV